MPIISGDEFQPPKPFSYGHINTMAPYFFGQVPRVEFSRKRIITPDDDFLDLDLLCCGSDTAVILCHGLEGSSQSNYVLLFADYLFNKGCDVIAMNYRGCSGEANKKVTSYNSGTTMDLDWVIKTVDPSYSSIYLIGFSLGGNLVLKYLGEGTYDLDPRIKRAVAISTPVHLSDASAALLKFENKLYQLKFIVSLYKKVRDKHRLFPNQISMKHFRKIRNLYDFDEYYTAPLFGYGSAEEYYADNQAIQWLDTVRIPACIINALDDPFLGDLCYPFEIAKNSEIVSLCVPKHGGHVGFARSLKDRTWILEKAWSFMLG